MCTLIVLCTYKFYCKIVILIIIIIIIIMLQLYFYGWNLIGATVPLALYYYDNYSSRAILTILNTIGFSIRKRHHAPLNYACMHACQSSLFVAEDSYRLDD